MALFLNINDEVLINIEKVISIIPNYEDLEITFVLQENGEDDTIIFRHTDYFGSKDKYLEEKENILKEAMEKIEDGLNEFRGTWVHPQVAINLAQWASPKFAVFVSKWVLEWFDGSNKRNYRLPYHLRRFLINNDKIPYTHFSVLNEMIHMLLAPLENYGYELPMSLMPDISMGKLFSKWCRDKGLDPSTFPTYEHVFDDGKRPPVMARLYPIDLLADFKRFFHNVWVKERSIEYFEEKDPNAIESMKKYLLLLETDFKEYILIDNSENKI